jgi:DNA-binding MarR family transcriptional regulator
VRSNHTESSPRTGASPRIEEPARIEEAARVEEPARIDQPAWVEERARVPSETDQLLDAASAIRRGATSLASRARVQRLGALSINQTAVLGLVSRSGALTPKEIADRMHVSPQSLTRTLASLQDEAFVNRTPDPADLRQSIVAITQTGRTALREEMRPRDEWIAEVIQTELTESERELLVIASRLMERISEVDLFPGTTEP